ncbi:hypothetical protein EVAR_27629_1 [Eumeta japonica]|uniref:Uncharacterized protein n=1 Tax=Eumeta variegata TaxID=151549 RepID=A0A4C1V0F6_EUMVA|nr:hypothetical protein EVAR_27629_1 [Eumeta japonica]
MSEWNGYIWNLNKMEQATKKIYNVYGLNTTSVRIPQNWLKCFQSGNFDVKDEPRSGRPVTDLVDAILEKVEHDWHISSYDITKTGYWSYYNFGPFEKKLDTKKARYLGPTRAH